MTQMAKNLCNAGDPSLIPGSGRSRGGGHGNPLLYSGLENPMDRGVWWAAVHKVTESDMTERLTVHFHILLPLCYASFTEGAS